MEWTEGAAALLQDKVKTVAAHRNGIRDGYAEARYGGSGEGTAADPH